jgi:hypothetical protein
MVAEGSAAGEQAAITIAIARLERCIFILVSLVSTPLKNCATLGFLHTWAARSIGVSLERRRDCFLPGGRCAFTALKTRAA